MSDPQVPTTTEPAAVVARAQAGAVAVPVGRLPARLAALLPPVEARQAIAVAAGAGATLVLRASVPAVARMIARVVTAPQSVKIVGPQASQGTQVVHVVVHHVVHHVVHRGVSITTLDLR